MAVWESINNFVSPKLNYYYGMLYYIVFHYEPFIYQIEIYYIKFPSIKATQLINMIKIYMEINNFN